MPKLISPPYGSLRMSRDNIDLSAGQCIGSALVVYV